MKNPISGIFDEAKTHLVSKEKHDRAGVKQFIHVVEIWHFRIVHQVCDGKVLNLVAHSYKDLSSSLCKYSIILRQQFLSEKNSVNWTSSIWRQKQLVRQHVICNKIRHNFELTSS